MLYLRHIIGADGVKVHEENIRVIRDWLVPKDVGGPQYCSNNAATPGTRFFNFINPVVCNKLGSDGAVCTSTSSCRSCHLVSWHKSARRLSQLL